MNRRIGPPIISTLALFVAVLPAGADMSVDSLSRRAETVLRQAVVAVYPDADIEITMQALDPRLRFPDCPALSITLQGGPLGRASALARCPGPHTWSASLPARISVAMPVVVLRRPLARGERVEASDVELSTRDLADLRGQYLLDLEHAIGAESRRPLDADTVLAARHLKAPLTVRRGDQVAIVSGRGPVVVHATGIALDRGMTGEQIGVRNAQSNRVIRAWIIGTGRVSTAPPPPPPV